MAGSRKVLVGYLKEKNLKDCLIQILSKCFAVDNRSNERERLNEERLRIAILYGTLCGSVTCVTYAMMVLALVPEMSFPCP